MDEKILIEEFLKYRDFCKFTITDEQLHQFYLFYSYLVEKNKVMNLTAITELEEVVLKHFIDSLSILNYISLSEVNNVIDIGTGAGFPGIPLAIMLPEIQFSLVDSLNKRIGFINDVCKICNINNIYTYHGRAEDFGHKELFREKFDLCVSRAVANLSTLCEYCVPFIKVGGKFISYKSEMAEEEIAQAKNAFKELDISLCDNFVFNLPDTNIQRNLLCMNKNNVTKKKYPRSAGKPSKKPL